jgi:PAS domain S-box-containing protein
MDREFDSDLLRKIENEGTSSVFFEHLLSTLINNFPDYIYLKDTKSRFLLINNTLLKMFGLKKPEDVTGKTDFDFFAEEDARSYYEDEQIIMKTGKSKKNFIEKEVREDGSVRWLASTKVPIYDAGKKIIGIFGISRDITPRKKAEIELENRARELDCFIEISGIAKRKELSAEGYLKKIIDIIPIFLSHAYIVSSRVIIGHKAFRSPDFRETENYKTYKIKENNSKIGSLEVFFDRDIKKSPYKLPRETDQVLKLISDKVSSIMERKWLEKDLRKWEHIMKDAESHSDLYP